MGRTSRMAGCVATRQIGWRGAPLGEWGTMGYGNGPGGAARGRKARRAARHLRMALTDAHILHPEGMPLETFFGWRSRASILLSRSAFSFVTLSPDRA